MRGFRQLRTFARAFTARGGGCIVPWVGAFARTDGVALKTSSGGVVVCRLEADLASDAVMPFRLRDSWLVFEASIVKEVLGEQRWLVAPHRSRGLLGLCAWHGRAIAVLDILALLGLGAVGEEPLQRTLILQCEGNLVAVPVNEARAVLVLSKGMRRAAHVTTIQFSNTEIDDGKQVLALVDMHAVVRHLMGQARALDGSNDRARLA